MCLYYPQIFTVDVRNHGSSEHGNEMSADVLRDDLLMLMKNELQLDRCILIGHSLGGRIAMMTALSEVGNMQNLGINQRKTTQALKKVFQVT